MESQKNMHVPAAAKVDADHFFRHKGHCHGGMGTVLENVNTIYYIDTLWKSRSQMWKKKLFKKK